MEDKKIECANSLCKFKGVHGDVLKKRSHEQSEELGISIYDRVCPDCGHNEYYEVD